ncbi:MAG TPA: hypothetical protein PLN53_00560 [Terricaulis sp.]|nr:hypothetical protein [Terricaulis sp.]
MKKMKPWIISMFGLLAACSPSAAPPQETSDSVASAPSELVEPEGASESLKGVARELLVAMLRKDAVVIQRLEPSPGSLVEEGQLRPEVISFLDASNPSTGRRSLKQLSDIGELEVVIAVQDENRAFAIYVPREYRERISDPVFLETRWLKDYFACEFRSTPTGWKLGGSFCFDETGGPYPAEY